jgi:hypothetical protein
MITRFKPGSHSNPFLTTPCVLGLCLVVSLLGCGKTGFNSKGSSNTNTADPTSDGSGDSEGTDVDKDGPGSGDASGETDGYELQTDAKEIQSVGLGQAVDILILIDSSGSMTGDRNDPQEKQRLEAQLPAFIADMKKKLVQDRYQIFLIGEIEYNPGQDDKVFLFNDMPVDSTDSLNVIAEFLDRQANNLQPNRGKLQAGGTLEIILFTDDNAETNRKFDDEASFRYFLQTMAAHNYTKKARLHGAIGLSSSVSNSWCAIQRPGTAYSAIAKETGGLIQDLCKEDWAALVKAFGSKITETALGNTIALSKSVAAGQESKISVKLNGTQAEARCFSYDREFNTVSVATECLADITKLEVTYPIAKL